MLDYSKKRELILSMCDYMKEILDKFPYQDLIKNAVCTPATENLFQTQDAKKYQKIMQGFYTMQQQSICLFPRDLEQISKWQLYSCVHM